LVRFDHCSLGSNFSIFFSLYNSKYSSNLFLSPLLFPLSLKSSLLSFSNLLSLTGQGGFRRRIKTTKSSDFYPFRCPWIASLWVAWAAISLKGSLNFHYLLSIRVISPFSVETLFRSFIFCCFFFIYVFLYFDLYVSLLFIFFLIFLFLFYLENLLEEIKLGGLDFFYLDIVGRNGINGFVWF